MNLMAHISKAAAASALALVLCCAGCHRDMRDQPRYEALEASSFFSNGMASRPLVEGTIARGHLNEDEVFYTGKEGDQLVLEVPLEINRELLERGEQRFNIYCSVCHDRTGTGDGMIVQRGFRKPPSLHLERLRNAPAGHYFDVMTHGFGAMPSFRIQVPPQDRWAIAAYIRVLQMSQQASLDDVPPEERAKLEEAAQ
jgi:mono/diheme cytochrome c family protein